jgi:hypothetical protein
MPRSEHSRRRCNSSIWRYLIVGLGVAQLLIGSACVCAQDAGDDEEVEFQAGSEKPGSANVASYTLRKSTISPNGNYGIVFPAQTNEDDARDYVVAVGESRILGEIDFELDDAYFPGKNYGGLDVYWTPDSSVVVVISAGKWTPRELVVIELKDGHIARQTPLFAELEKAIAAAAPKESRLPNPMVEMDLTDVSWKTGENRLLHLECDVLTNPKGLSDEESWCGNVVANWDLGKHAFTAVKVTQTSFRKAGEEDP